MFVSTDHEGPSVSVEQYESCLVALYVALHRVRVRPHVRFPTNNKCITQGNQATHFRIFVTVSSTREVNSPSDERSRWAGGQQFRGRSTVTEGCLQSRGVNSLWGCISTVWEVNSPWGKQSSWAMGKQSGVG